MACSSGDFSRQLQPKISLTAKESILSASFVFRRSWCRRCLCKLREFYNFPCLLSTMQILCSSSSLSCQCCIVGVSSKVNPNWKFNRKMWEQKHKNSCLAKQSSRSILAGSAWHELGWSFMQGWSMSRLVSGSRALSSQLLKVFWSAALIRKAILMFCDKFGVD